MMALNFEKYAQEGNEFVNKLAADLGHPEKSADQASFCGLSSIH